MDPKAPVGAPTYTDGVDANGTIDPDVTDKKNSKYYKERIIHNDGSVTVNVYERHTNTLVLTKADPPNAAQKKAWDDAQPKPQTPGQIATDANAVELQRQREANAALPESLDPAYETNAERARRGADVIAAQGAAARQAEADRIAADRIAADKVKADAVEARAKADELRRQEAHDRVAAGGGTILDQGTEGVFIVKPDGTHVKTDIPTKPRPSTTVIVTDENNDRHTVTTDADGNSTVTPLNLPKKSAGAPIPSSATGWTPDPSQVDLGFGARRKEVAGLLESGSIGDPTLQETVDKANALLKQDYDTATLVSTNLGTIQTGEAEIYKGGITQRTQDQGQANARLSAATNVFDDAIKSITASGSKAKSGASVVGALEEMFNNYRLFAEQFGGLKETPRIEPGEHMSRKAPVFQPLAMVASPGTPGQPVDPLAPTPPPASGSGLEAASPVGFPPAVPGVPPGTGMESASPVGFPQAAPIPVDVTQMPMPPVIGPDGVPVAPPPTAPEVPAAPVAPPVPPPVVEPPFIPPPTGAPVGPAPAPAPPPEPAPAVTMAPTAPPSLAEQATMAQRIVGVPETSAALLAASPSPAPFAPPDPLQAQQAQAMIGQAPRTVGGSLAWAQELGFPPGVLDAFMQIEGGLQMPAA